MKHLIVMLILIVASCAMPTESTERHLGDPPPTWGQVWDAGAGYCGHLWGYQCANTGNAWYYECLDDYAYDLADEAEATGCTAQAQDWMLCEATQFFTCENGWPYQWTDYCHAEADAYEACRRDA